MVSSENRRKVPGRGFSWRLFAATAALALSVLLALNWAMEHSPTRISPNGVAGEYTSELPGGRATLRLEKDGTFLETYVLRSGATKSVRGRWRLEGDPDHTDLKLTRGLDLDTTFGHSDGEELTTLRILGFGHHVRLSIDDEDHPEQDFLRTD